jgi:hypothetical protein
MTIVGRTKVVNPRSFVPYAKSRCGVPTQGCQSRDCVWPRSADRSREPEYLAGGVSSTERIPSNLHWNAGARRKESFAENVIQYRRGFGCQAVRARSQS